jgi:hypothetical protein
LIFNNPWLQILLYAATRSEYFRLVKCQGVLWLPVENIKCKAFLREDVSKLWNLCPIPLFIIEQYNMLKVKAFLAWWLYVCRESHAPFEYWSTSRLTVLPPEDTYPYKDPTVIVSCRTAIHTLFFALIYV